MGSVNKVILVGHLGRDPECKFTNTGLAVANFSMATTEKVGKDKADKTEWHRIVAFGKLAEICGDYLKKGKQVYIEGRLQTREWEDKGGNRRWSTEVIADKMVMLGGKDDRGEQERENDAPAENGAAATDDIPF